MIKASAQTTAEAIAAAALEALREDGFAGASSRAIARRGGFNQALIFYHYGSLEALLIAALARTSGERLARYRTAVDPIATVAELVPAMADLWEEDRAAGHVRVVSQMVSGTANRPELAASVLALMEPWIAFAEETMKRLLPEGLPTRELAYAIVTFYLGVNLMTSLDAEHERTDALFARARELAPLLGALLPPTGIDGVS